MVKARNYKQIKDELDKSLAGLQDENTDIDDMIKLYKQAEQLIQEMESYIKNAENTVKELKANFKKK